MLDGIWVDAGWLYCVCEEEIPIPVLPGRIFVPEVPVVPPIVPIAAPGLVKVEVGVGW